MLGPVKAWNIFYKYFIYRPEDPDENHDHIHLVNLENPHPEQNNLEQKNSMILIEDFTGNPDCIIYYYTYYIIVRYFAYSDSVFYMASSEEIKLFPLVDDVEKGEFIQMRPPEEEVATITKEDLKDMKVHGLYINKAGERYIVVALETPDNQIDFNFLYILQKPGAESTFEH